MIAREHARQARLAEVREEGQGRITSARIVVRESHLVGEIAGTYLERAGARVVDDGPVVARHPEVVDLERGASDVARGALAALVALRAILGLGSEEDVLSISGR